MPKSKSEKIMRKLGKESKDGIISNTDHTLSKYPIYYECKYWSENECEEIFNNVHTDRCALNIAGGVYVAVGLWCFTR
jgi:hypothetical protein